MTIFTFDTITPADALTISASDILKVPQSFGPATNATILYANDGSGDVSMTLGGKTILFGPGFVTLSHTPGSLIFLGPANNLYVGGTDADVYTGDAVFGTGTPGTDTAAFGGGGDDMLSVSGRTDVLQGNAGSDTLTGATGDDTIYGGQDNDRIDVGAGASNFGQGNKGDDSLTGSGTADTLLGGQGNDSVSGAGFLDGNLGDDVITGAGQLFGEGGNDTLASTTTGTVTATLSGGDGNDSIVAGHGHDSITGDAGNDTISVTGGGHTLSGGPGADKFIFGAGSTATGSVPAIVDWDGSQDTLSFLGFTPNPSDFTATTAPDYATAVTTATQLSTQNHFSFVGVQVGSDFILFAGGAGGPSAVVDLVGRTLADFNPTHNLV